MQENKFRQYCFALDLVDDPVPIAAYEAHHQAVWPAIIDSIKTAGITSMQIYRTGNRLFMIIKAGAAFSFEAKQAADQLNPAVQEWENLMWQYQQALPGSAPGEKWRPMECIFSL